MLVIANTNTKVRCCRLLIWLIHTPSRQLDLGANIDCRALIKQSVWFHREVVDGDEDGEEQEEEEEENRQALSGDSARQLIIKL